MNEGDLRGDLYFDLRAYDLPLRCADPIARKSPTCTNPEVTDNTRERRHSPVSPVGSRKKKLRLSHCRALVAPLVGSVFVSFCPLAVTVFLAYRVL